MVKSKKSTRRTKKVAKKRGNKLFKTLNKRILGLALVFVGIGAIGGVAYLRSSHALVDLPDFRMECGIDHYGPDDPIVFPGQPGVSHMHSFYSNTSTNAFSTAASLTASAGSCAYTGTYDRSAYWIPSVYYTNPDGTSTRFSSSSQQLIVYYRRVGGASGPKVQAFPTGLRMVAGNSSATSAQPSSVTSWDCGDGGPSYAYLPNCTNASSGHTPVGFVSFPNCWDGVHLDSADHKSHMAYSNPTTGVCPAGYPVSFPQIDFEDWLNGTTGGSNYYLSSGGIYSMHGDFYAAWNLQLLNGLIDQCMNTVQRNCSVVQVGSNGQVSTAGTNIFNLNNYSATSPTVPPQTPPPAPKPSPSPAPRPTSPSPTPTPTPSTGGTTGLTSSTPGNPNGSTFPGGSLAPDPSATNLPSIPTAGSSTESTITPSSTVVTILDNIKKPIIIGGAVLIALIVFIAFKTLRHRGMPWQK